MKTFHVNDACAHIRAICHYIPTHMADILIRQQRMTFRDVLYKVSEKLSLFILDFKFNFDQLTVFTASCIDLT